MISSGYKSLILMLAVGAITNVANAMPTEDLPEFSLEKLVVSATKVPTTMFNANANVNVVGRQEIENKHFNNIGEAIRNLPGVNVQNMGGSGEAYADNTLYINGSKNIVVLIDGVRINFNGGDAEKFSSADFIDMNLVERIEVLKGSASTLYGSDAQGGVINIVTRKQIGNGYGKLHTDYGSFKTSHVGLSAGGTEKGLNWYIAAQNKKSGSFKDGQGRRVPETVDAKTFNVKLGKTFDEKNDLSLMYTQYKSDYSRIKPKKGQVYEKATPIYGTKDNNNFVMSYNHKFSESSNNILSFSRNSKDINDNYTARKPVQYVQTNLSINDQLTNKIGEHHTLVGGFEYTKDSIDRASQTIKNKDFHNTALYIQDIWDFSKQYNLTYGLRYDSHSKYGNHTSGSATIGFTPDDKTNFYASYKQYFIAPTVNQLYSSGSGNPDLKYETGYTYELGMKHYFDKNTTIDLNAYRRKSSDAIGLVKKNDGSDDSIYTNYDIEKTKGFSVKVNKSINDCINLGAGYTYIYVDPQPNKNPNKNGYLPRGVWNFNIGYDNDRLTVDFDGRGVINREGRKAAKVHTSTSFWVWDISANYKCSNSIKLFGKIGNIFNTNYTERVYDLDPEAWYASPGRIYMVGMEYTF